MPINVPLNFDLTLAGYSFSSRMTISGTTAVGTEITKPGGTLTVGPTSGTLSTRTDNDTGVVTATSHGLSTSDVVDVYWDGGLRHSMEATVDGNDVTLDGGAGDNLPSQGTAVKICKQTEIDDLWPDADGDSIKLLLAQANFSGHVAFQEADGSLIVGVELSAGNVFKYSSDEGDSNPFASAVVAKLQVSAGEALPDDASFRCAALL